VRNVFKITEYILEFMIDLVQLLNKNKMQFNFNETRINFLLESRNGRILRESINRFVDERNFFLGLGIWLGERTKEMPDEKRIELINSDPFIIEIFLKFLKELGIPKDRIRVKIIIKNGDKSSSREKTRSAESFWMKRTKIVKENFWKTIVVESKTKRRRKNYFGTLTLRVLKGTVLYNIFSSFCAN